ncbi:hypothetical protein CSW64_16735 [Caulobacter mirabilis]|uniref:Uncharacterized protein n=1 Tax=Caulobacter mirabilis TaxID=69666 RepID=A0A2D2B104_9CAUL|nr:hypothetical protein CSW64_16735 [Caulobacter mirabilis]
MAPRNFLIALAGGVLLWLGSAALDGGNAEAQCCAPPPPPCCTPPAPPPCCRPPSPPPRPPQPPVCCGGGGRTNVIVNNNAVAVAVSGASAGAGARAGAAANVYYGGGGGGGGYMPPSGGGMIQGLNVQGLQKTRKVAYEATRTRMRRVVIQAFCLDDRNIPHPASQVFPDRDVAEAFEGELYRCIAGTRMQTTIADFNERISFDGGQTMICAKGEALHRRRGAGGASDYELVCRPQKPARDCNERSLLRRFGAGVKVLTMISVEKYVTYREEVVAEEASAVGALNLDGGVGGYVY